MKYKELVFKIKRQIAVKWFKDVMDSNSRIYLKYWRDPTIGIMELHSYAKNRLLDDLEQKLNDGINGPHLYDGLFRFYSETPLYDFTGTHYEMTEHFLRVINDFESRTGTIVDKEKIYLLRTLCQISLSNTIGAMASWELANKEKQRTTGVLFSTNDLIDNLPERTIVNPINYVYSHNTFIKEIAIKYPTIISENLKNLILTINGTDAISLLSCGIRNVQVAGLIQTHNNILEINKIFAQEIINSLCILNESIIKDYPEVAATISRKKDQQIGKMLSPTTLGLININVSNILGNSIGGYSGLYLSSQLLDDDHFNTNFPAYITHLLTNTLTPDEFKAFILIGIHALRNKVLHDYDETLCYYSDTDLFINTIGLLFIGVNVTKNLR